MLFFIKLFLKKNVLFIRQNLGLRISVTASIKWIYFDIQIFCYTVNPTAKFTNCQKLVLFPSFEDAIYSLSNNPIWKQRCQLHSCQLLLLFGPEKFNKFFSYLLDEFRQFAMIKFSAIFCSRKKLKLLSSVQLATFF